eukprot:COSAG02_NODE_21064_length_804_cov_1.330496_1_plen_44_part_10
MRLLAQPSQRILAQPADGDKSSKAAAVCTRCEACFASRNALFKH